MGRRGELWLAVALAVITTSGVGGYLLLRERRLAQEAEHAAEVERETRACAEQDRSVAELRAAGDRLWDAMRTRSMSIAPIGEVIEGDGADAWAAARTASTRIYQTSYDELEVLSGETYETLPLTDFGPLLERHAADFATLRRAAHHERIGPPVDLDEAVFAEDHPWALPALVVVLLGDAPRHPAPECFAQVLDVARLRQIAELRDNVFSNESVRSHGRLTAVAFDACAARASAGELAQAYEDALQLARHPVPLDLLLQGYWLDQVRDGELALGSYGPGVPEWQWCSNDGGGVFRGELGLQADAARALTGCVGLTGGVATSWGECVRGAWRVCGIASYCSGSTTEAHLRVGDDQIWHRVMALDVATRLHAARGDLGSEPPERSLGELRDPYAGAALGFRREADVIEIGFRRADRWLPVRLSPE